VRDALTGDISCRQLGWTIRDVVKQHREQNPFNARKRVVVRGGGAGGCGARATGPSQLDSRVVAQEAALWIENILSLVVAGLFFATFGAIGHRHFIADVRPHRSVALHFTAHPPRSGCSHPGELALQYRAARVAELSEGGPLPASHVAQLHLHLGQYNEMPRLLLHNLREINLEDGASACAALDFPAYRRVVVRACGCCAHRQHARAASAALGRIHSHVARRQLDGSARERPSPG
jgi:hypothetical protein